MSNNNLPDSATNIAECDEYGTGKWVNYVFAAFAVVFLLALMVNLIHIFAPSCDIATYVAAALSIVILLSTIPLLCICVYNIGNIERKHIVAKLAEGAIQATFLASIILVVLEITFPIVCFLAGVQCQDLPRVVAYTISNSYIASMLMLLAINVYDRHVISSHNE